MELTTIVNALKSGDDRIALPTPIFLGIVTVAGMLQWKLVLTPCEKVSTRTKQIVSIPLLAIQLLIPIILAGGHKALTVVAGLFLFNTALRCVEAIYVAPALQNREAYIDPNKLHKDLWSCLRRFPLEHKEDGKDKSGGGDTATVKVDAKNKKLRPWYHLIPPMLFTILVSNFVASWYATFSGQDAFDIQEKRPGLFFVFFVFAVVVLTFVINGAGYILQLIYTLTYGGGYYDPDEWRLLMSHPALATSLNDLWNYRWHQLFRSIWLAIPFRPVLLLTQDNSNPEKKEQQQRSQASIALATLAVFFVSGVMHEYLILCGSGVQAYWDKFIGQECMFFTLHGMAVILERAVQPYLKVQSGVLADTLKRVWVIWFAFRTFPLFLNGFAYWELWHANPFNMFTPYFLENVWRKHPILRAFCGSYL